MRSRLQRAEFFQLGDQATDVFDLAASLARWGFYQTLASASEQET